MALVPLSLMAGRNKGSWAPAFPYRLDPNLFVSFNLAYIETVIKQWYLASHPPPLMWSSHPRGPFPTQKPTWTCSGATALIIQEDTCDSCLRVPAIALLCWKLLTRENQPKERHVPKSLKHSAVRSTPSRRIISAAGPRPGGSQARGQGETAVEVGFKCS